MKPIRKIIATCISLIVSILFINCYLQLLDINTLILLLYLIFVFSTSICSGFMVLQDVLSMNKPFDTNSNKLLSLLQAPIYNLKINLISVSTQPVDERIQTFVKDIEQLCIRKWYIQYISKNEQFLTECTKLLDMVVRRFMQISGQINTEKLLHGFITILLRHVKEYKKAVKKAQLEGSVEKQYRYGHLGSKNVKCFEHFTLQITSKTLRHFINWELYNSVPCHCLNAILARKLVSHMIHFLSAPGFINYRVLINFDKDNQLGKYQSISVSDVDHYTVKENLFENKDNIFVVHDDNLIEAGDDVDCVDSMDKDVKDGVKEKEEKEVKDKTEVKVYESRSTNKTWRHSSDLDCISLGQDILFLSNISEEDVKPDWVQMAEDFKHAKETTGSVSVSVASSIASTAALITTSSVKDTMKDLQQSTTNAMHKIEDEAAGVVEGILDLGMAGLRKGLRLTGLQDNAKILESSGATSKRPKSESKDIPKTNKTRLTKLSHVNSDEEKFDPDHHKINKKMDEESFEDVYMNPLHHLIEEITPNYEGDILLERSPVMEKRTSSNESNQSSHAIIPTMQFLHVEDSPEPEYEDNPDLATTTAKLRSLLAMKTEGNTPVASPMTFIPTPQDISASGSSVDEMSLTEVDGAPSMYKAWAKTVFQNTLNTIKTALPGNATEEVACPLLGNLSNFVQYNGDDNWHFEETEDGHFAAVLEKFLAERQQFCAVDSAFDAVEAIDAVDLGDQMEGSFIFIQNERKYEEELDDFDTRIPITKALVDLICELIEETYPPLVKENIVKTFLLTFGSVLEEKLRNVAEQLVKCLINNIGHLPKMESTQTAKGMKMEELVTPIVSAFKDTLGKWLDEKSLKAVITLAMESLQSHKINVDTSLQILELMVCEVITACNQSSPTYSV